MDTITLTVALCCLCVASYLVAVLWTVATPGYNLNEQQLQSPGLLNTTVAAAGTNQGTAAALVQGMNYVTGADGTKGVIVPTNQPGSPVVVINSNGANALKVYPATGGTISGGSANAALSVGSNKTVILYPVDALNWWGVLSA